MVFSGVFKECVSSSFLPPVSTWFVVVKYDMDDGWLWEIKLSLQYFVLSRCDDNSEHGGTTNVVLGYGYGQLCWLCL